MQTSWNWDKEKLCGHAGLVGVDEAGRGALAGPVVAGAVSLGAPFYENVDLESATAGVDDSKKLSPRARDDWYAQFEQWASAGLLQMTWASASVAEIESLNILGATKLAMSRALDALQPRTRILIDGNPLKDFPYAHEGIIAGDAKSLVIAMASIVAKVNRDRIMTALAADFPQYALDTHKGYGTAKHISAIEQWGPASVHRPSFLHKISARTQQLALAL
ncbi:MAG: hypothetical protein A2Y14_01045 [Verrucomicrobia bacterium GWF2_51_19]|nr:MAG: hypothetical protein A2Y14_01045 [Verrucomicrobia bacterium GWF2_51_19]HCJ12070.1 ribonuclease HII [Opitutae bacterium]